MENEEKQPEQENKTEQATDQRLSFIFKYKVKDLGNFSVTLKAKDLNEALARFAKNYQNVEEVFSAKLKTDTV